MNFLLYNGNIIKKREVLEHFPPATPTVRVVVVKIYLVEREPPFSLRRRWVAFLCSRTFFRKKCALISRTIPFRTSRRISRNVSMIITSFPNEKGKRETTNHPNVPQTKVNGHWVLGFDPETLMQYVK
jgi:hypothetical protein